jgi:predicted secreted protein
MNETKGILLNEHFLNEMTIGGELGWVIKDYNVSTGYMWRFRPDNSGTTELVEKIILHPSTPGTVGVPGKICWKFKALMPGKGSMIFELYPPGPEKPAGTTIIDVEVAE